MKTYDIIIVGAGPGGLTAGIYAGRQGTKTLILDKGLAGGIGREVPLMENYPGFDTISGFELVEKMKLQCMKYIELHENEIVKNIEKNNDNFLVTTHKDEYCGKTIILATGSSHKHLEIPGEEEYLGKGVSYCATCDGLFFKDKDAIMIGGGNSALQEAIFLDNVGCNVTIIHRRDELRAQQYLQKEIKERNIDVIYDTTVEEIKGNALVKETYPLLKECKDINFVGSIEAREIPNGAADVIVCEAFVGNVILKLYEGLAKMLLGEIKNTIMSSFKTKIGGLLIKSSLNGLKERFNAKNKGGAPLLGLKGLVVKIHGNSHNEEVKSAIFQCINFKENGVNEKIAENIGKEVAK